MNLFGTSKKLYLALLALIVCGALPDAGYHAVPAAPLINSVTLMPHRAIYDLKLSKSQGARAVETVRGRILYDFSGSACEGYKLQFRQVSELGSGEGKVSFSDVRSTTWEDASAQEFRFNSESLFNERATQSVVGHAAREESAIDVRLTKPKKHNFSAPARAVFPTEHLRRIIAAAREGKGILELPVYDGSETGEKLYNTLTVIGRPIEAGKDVPNDASGKIPAFAKLKRWPVTISYFDTLDEKREHEGEQMPAYTISFELYENGVSRALVLDYNDVTITGEMTSLDMKKVKSCP
jgi:phage FluMu protein gp41